jgi:hypothetical protein
MKKNIGEIDKAVRLIMAIIICLMVAAGMVKGIVPIVILDAIAIIFVLTSAIGFCPTYTLFGMSTK